MSEQNIVTEYTDFFKKFKKVEVLRDEQCLSVNTKGYYTYTGTDGTNVMVEKADDTLYVSQNYDFLWLLGKMFPYLAYGDEILHFIKQKHTASLTAYAQMSIKKEFQHYCTASPFLSLRKSYVMVRGILPSGATLNFDELGTSRGTCYVNGQGILGNYDCPAYDDNAGQLLTVIYTQTDYDLANNVTGNLAVTHADCPLEDYEIFVHIGTDTHLKPTIEDLLQYDGAKSFYCDGSWAWSCTNTSPITTLSVDGILSIASGKVFSIPGCVKLLIPNTGAIYRSAAGTAALRYVDMTNATGAIADNAFSESQIRNSLVNGIITNKFVIGDSVTSIGNSAFQSCTNLATVDIGDSVTSIGNYAFQSCTNLATVDIGDSVTSIGNSAFQGCTNLATVDIGDSVTSIGSEAFKGCTNLATVDIGLSVKSIDQSTFNGCGNLRNVTVPVGYNCTNNYFRQANITNASMSAIIANCANRTGSATGYWYVSSAALANMSAETLAAATAKNWNIRT